MLTLQINPIVLQTLKQHFPKPEKAATNALDKYIKLLTKQLTNSILCGRNVWMQSNDLYSISVAKQRNRGSQIGSQKIRLQNWLEDNNLQLFQVVVIGSNQNKKLSVIKPTELVTITHTDTHITSIHDIETDHLRKQLELQLLSNEELYREMYPNIYEMSDEEITSTYNIVPIDMTSLNYYLVWLKNESKFISEDNKKQFEIQADTILRIAQHTNGYYLQEKKASSFGRNYYLGTSVQNVNKELRRAMLGNCYEYDLRSSVFTWKIGYAHDCYQTLKTTETFEKTFHMSILFLEDKVDFYKTLRYYTFDKESILSKDDKDKILKRAITAIGFGARRGSHGFMLNGTTWKNPALVEIFKYQPEARDRFMNCSMIKQFLHEQNLIDTYIFDFCKSQKAAFLKKEEVRTFSGSLSKSKVIAYLYQHAETEIMDFITAEIEKLGSTVLARIHDAIIVKYRLGESKHEIELLLQSKYENKYWHLTMKELKAYERPYCLDSAEIDAQREKIAEEERIAKLRSNTELLNYSWSVRSNSEEIHNAVDA